METTRTGEMELNLHNHSPYPYERVRALVGWTARELEISEAVGKIEVRALTEPGERERPFSGECRYPMVLRPGWKAEIELRLAPPEFFPHRERFRKTAPEYVCRDWVEGLVSLAAHELTHARQALRLAKGRAADRRAGRRMRIWRMSEVEAEKNAERILRWFRSQRPRIQDLR